MTAKMISGATSAEAAAISPTMRMVSPELYSTSSSVSGSESPVSNPLQSMKQTPEGGFKGHSKREETFPMKRDYATFKKEDSNSFTCSHDVLGLLSDSGKKLGHGLIADEEIDDDDEDPKIKRKAQNRAAQRAFRERKERYVKDLEKKIKYVQDSHVYATTQLFQENQYLRSIVRRLELENSNMKGESLDVSETHGLPPLPDKRLPGQSWLATIGPPVSLPVINSFPPTPLAPLQIRSALPVEENKPKQIVDIVPEKSTKKKKKQQTLKTDSSSTFLRNEKHIGKKEPKEKVVHGVIKSDIASPSAINSSTADVASATTNSSHQFTFSIATPATLRATSDIERLRKKESIQVVPLYPDHGHPANCLLGKNQQKRQRDNIFFSSTSSYMSLLSSGIDHKPRIACGSCSSNSVASVEEEDRVLSLANKSSDSACTKSNEHEFDNSLLFNNDNNNKRFQDMVKLFVDAGGDPGFSTTNLKTPDWNMETILDSI